MTGKLSKNFHGVGIGPLSNILVVKSKVQISSVTKQKKFMKTIMKIITKINNDYLLALSPAVSFFGIKTFSVIYVTF